MIPVNTLLFTRYQKTETLMQNYMQVSMKRDISMDVLRILAALSVILLHVSAIYLEKTSVNSIQWSVANILDSSTRWCVPVFVMLSGAFLLQKDISLKYLYKVKISHLFILLVGWNAFYNIFRMNGFPADFKEFFSFMFTNWGGTTYGSSIC